MPLAYQHRRHRSVDFNTQRLSATMGHDAHAHGRARWPFSQDCFCVGAIRRSCRASSRERQFIDDINYICALFFSEIRMPYTIRKSAVLLAIIGAGSRNAPWRLPLFTYADCRRISFSNFAIGRLSPAASSDAEIRSNAADFRCAMMPIGSVR